MLSSHEILETGRPSPQKPCEHVWITYEVVLTVSRADGFKHRNLMSKIAPVTVPEQDGEVIVSADLLDAD